MLKIDKLSITLNNKKILENISFTAKNGDIIGIFGKNGSGKTTLLKAIVSHYDIKKTSGTIMFDSKDITNLTTQPIAKNKILLLNQNPIEIPGVKLLDLLIQIDKSINEKPNLIALSKKIDYGCKFLGLNKDILENYVNVNLSGGQKKLCEILQSIIFEPKVLLIDEIDAGLDIDSIKKIIKYIKSISNNTIILIVSHQINFIKKLNPNKVIVLADKKIAKAGTTEIIDDIAKNGYSKYSSINDEYKCIKQCKTK
ncbi:ABC transporter ATP-binding protein [Bacilli bacterium]|nr:ABC transporter ATP-binding protein [Bacilli bacterium]